MEPPRERPAQGSIWRHRDLRVIIPARALSTAGDTFIAFSLLLRVYNDHGGTGEVAVLLACFAAPIFLTIGIAGHASDRYDSRRLLVGASLVQAAAATALAVSGTGPGMLLLVVVLQLGQAIATPTWAALLPRVVGEDDLGRATAIQQGTLAVTGVAAAAAAGVVVGAWDVRTALLTGAGVFGVLALAALTIRTRRHIGATSEDIRLLAHLWSTRGWQALRADRVTWALFASMVPFLLALETINVVEVFLVRGQLHATTAMFGVVQACSAAGALVGALLAGRARSELARVRVAVGAVALAGVAMASAAVAPNILAVAAAFAGIGMFVMASNVSMWPVLMIRTHDKDRGKVNAAVNGVGRVVGMAALGFGAVLGDVLGPRATFTLAATLSVVVSTVAWVALHRHLRPDGTFPEPATRDRLTTEHVTRAA